MLSASPLSSRLQPRQRMARGMAIILVLSFLAITLAVSYATLRGQATARHLARNTSRSLDARAAAESGLAAALKKMSDSSWLGIDTPISGNVTDDAWYDVTFTAGDAALTPGSSDYGEWPFRVTVVSTGYAADPADSVARAVHRIRAVVQLVRSQFTASPTAWTTVTNYTCYQWANRNVLVQFPVRASGPVNILGRLLLCPEYPQDGTARNQYLSDLNLMRLAGRGDHRPFSGPVTIAYSRQDAANMSQLTTRLGLTTHDTTASTNPPLTHPGSVTGYRLYPGGKLYAPPVIQDLYGSTIGNISLAADPQLNPLGVFRSRGPLNIQSNVRVTGTIITDGASPEIQIYGTNVVLEAANLPQLNGSSQTWQLPNALVLEHLRIHGNSNVQIRGATIVWDEFELRRGEPATQFSLTGHLITAGLTLRGRDAWTMSASTWGNDLDDLNSLSGALGAAIKNVIRSQQGLGANDPIFFPEYMQFRRAFVHQPTLTIQPDSSGVRSRWQDWSQPIYTKNPSDPGLRWDLVRYADGI